MAAADSGPSLREVAHEHPEAVERLAERIGGETGEWLRSYVDDGEG